MSYVIEHQDDGHPVYFSCSVTAGHPAGSWGAKKDALQFAREKDAQDFAKVFLRPHVDTCRYVVLK